MLVFAPNGPQRDVGQIACWRKACIDYCVFGQIRNLLSQFHLKIYHLRVVDYVCMLKQLLTRSSFTHVTNYIIL